MGRGKGVVGRKGEGLLRNMYKGHMDKVKGGRIEGGRQQWVGQGGVLGGEWRQLYLNNSKKN